jgi:hypothetical protein
MTSTSRNSISINEWLDNINYFIHPLVPDEFDLTPILRARYGNLLNDDIASVRLYAEHRHILLTIIESGNTAPVIIDFANTLINEKTFNEHSHRNLNELFFRENAPEAPSCNATQEERQDWFKRIFSNLLWLFDSNITAKYLPVFSPHYLALLERIQLNHDAEEDLIYTETRLENTVAFYTACVESLATPLQKQTINKVLTTLATTMKNQEASGILNDDDLKTYWDEMGVLANKGSDNELYDMLCNHLEADVYYAIKDLPEAEQFALWFFSDEVNSDLERWFMSDYENVTLDNIKKNFSEISVDIRDELLGVAMNDLSPAATKHLGY